MKWIWQLKHSADFIQQKKKKKKKHDPELVKS